MLKFFFRIRGYCYRKYRLLQKRAFLFEYKALYSNRFHVHPTLAFGTHFSIFFDLSNSSIDVGQNVEFRDFCQIRTGTNGKLKIGSNVFFNNFCSIHSFYSIQIGNNNQFGEGIRMYDVNHRYKEQGKLISEQGYIGDAIIIGDNCWIGSNVTILKGVTIGNNVVIGANCLIHVSIPSDSLVVQKQNLEIKKKSNSV